MFDLEIRNLYTFLLFIVKRRYTEALKVLSSHLVYCWISLFYLNGTNLIFESNIYWKHIVFKENSILSPSNVLRLVPTLFSNPLRTYNMKFPLIFSDLGKNHNGTSLVNIMAEK